MDVKAYTKSQLIRLIKKSVADIDRTKNQGARDFLEFGLMVLLHLSLLKNLEEGA